MKITLDQINQLLAYLGNRPYKEVFGLINMLQDIVVTKDKLEVQSEIKED